MLELLCDLVFVGFVVFVAESDAADHPGFEFFLFWFVEVEAQTDESVAFKCVRGEGLVVEYFAAQMGENETLINEVQP